MTEIDDPDVLRREIRTMLERVTDRGSLIFFQWLVRRVLANYPITFGVLVAFSGTVTIEEQKYTEENMTPGTGDIQRRSRIPRSEFWLRQTNFKRDSTNRYCTLCIVDKRLGGSEAWRQCKH